MYPNCLLQAMFWCFPPGSEALLRSSCWHGSPPLPVVATNVGGTGGEMVNDGETGYLVPPGDSLLLGDHLKRVLEDPEQVRSMIWWRCARGA